jgi:glucose-6-phosphate isomerase
MLSKSPAWTALQAHADDMHHFDLAAHFQTFPERARGFSFGHAGLYFDYSKNLITDHTMKLLMDLARQQNVPKKRDAMFAGEKINKSENRAVLHTALRAPKDAVIEIDGENIMPTIAKNRAQMKNFADHFQKGAILGATGKPLTHVINIGIGGSDLGPRMVCDALKSYQNKNISLRFVSNIDGADIHEALKNANPETTLFVIASKSFTTQETMQNAVTARAWLETHIKNNDSAVSAHFVALTKNADKAAAFGIKENHIFIFHDWVGGRYSLWSPIGLSIALAIGFDGFQSLLDGAYVMDNHFREAPLEHNMSVILGLLGVWYRNFMGAQSYAVLPYAEDLALFPSWLQQLDMESNGKSTTIDGDIIDYDTGAVVFGQTGTNAQHAFHQLLHQGTALIPADFIGFVKANHPYDEHQQILLAHMIAQAQALMEGRTYEEKARHFDGNRPSTMILLDRLDPFHLGMLLALYEHKIFVQGALWNINSFDQWGVELGKELAARILNPGQNMQMDASTKNLLAYLQNHTVL